MSTRIPSVNDTYFQHKLLTRIHGQPTYETLQTLSTEIKANASSVPSTLGGGHYGHLGLILSDDRYATLAHTVPWVSPANPGPFVPPAAGTGPQIEAAKDLGNAAGADDRTARDRVRVITTLAHALKRRTLAAPAATRGRPL